MSLVLRDGVSMQGIAGRHDLPGQPARAEHLVAGQEAREMPGLTTAAALVVRDGLSDGLDLSLMTVCAWEKDSREVFNYASLSCFYCISPIIGFKEELKKKN